MFINKLDNNIKIPYKYIKGSFKERQTKSYLLIEDVYKNLSEKIKDDYSIFNYDFLQKTILSFLPNKDLKIIIENLSKNKKNVCEGFFKTKYDNNYNINAFLVLLNGISSSIRARHLPVVLHEFQHLSDVIYHPKYLSRLQSLNKKGLDNKRYEKFYDSFYYANESAQNAQEKEEILKIIKKNTKKFLRKLNISDKMDCIQDMRYSLESEIAAYSMQRKIANDLRSKGLMVSDFDFYDYPKSALFREKIDLLKQIAIEYITKERTNLNARSCKKQNLNS